MIYNINTIMVEQQKPIKDLQVDVNFYGYNGADPYDEQTNCIFRWTKAIHALRSKVILYRGESKKNELNRFQVTISLPNDLQFQFVDSKINKQYLTSHPKMNVPKTSTQARRIVYTLDAFTCYPIPETMKINGCLIKVYINYSKGSRYQISHFLGTMVHQQIRFSFLPRQLDWIEQNQIDFDGKTRDVQQVDLVDNQDWKWGVPSVVIKTMNSIIHIFEFFYSETFLIDYQYWESSTKKQQLAWKKDIKYLGQPYAFWVYVLVPYIPK